jgi:hypothetical protein
VFDFELMRASLIKVKALRHELALNSSELMSCRFLWRGFLPSSYLCRPPIALLLVGGRHLSMVRRMDTSLPYLSGIYGPENASSLASAYEAVILTTSHGDLGHTPDRAARLKLLEAMLVEGRRAGFDPERLKLAALAAGN